MDGGSPCRMAITRNGPVDFMKVLCHPIDFKKVLCRPVEFMEVPCHPVDFKKVPCRISLMPKKCCVAVSIFGVYTPSSLGPYVDNYCLTLTQSIPQSSNGAKYNIDRFLNSSACMFALISPLECKGVPVWPEVYYIKSQI